MRNWLVVLSLFVGLQSFAQNEILGTWYNDIKSSKIEIYEEKGLYYGRITWLEDPTNSTALRLVWTNSMKTQSWQKDS